MYIYVLVTISAGNYKDFILCYPHILLYSSPVKSK